MWQATLTMAKLYFILLFFVQKGVNVRKIGNLTKKTGEQQVFNQAYGFRKR